MTRRGNNEGSIFQRKDGRWCAAITIDGKRLYLYGKTRKEVAQKLKDTLAQVDAGLTIKAAKYTLDGYLAEWMGSMRSSVRPRTWEQYDQVIRTHINPYIGKLRLKDLRPDHIQKLYNLKQDQLGAATIRIMHAILHKSLKQALKWGLVSRNSADAVTRPREVRAEMTVLTAEQAQSLLSYVTGSRYEALYYLALITGLRRGELLGLKWSDLDWVTGVLMVQRQLLWTKTNGLAFAEPKTKKGRRPVKLGMSAIDKLRKHLALQQTERRFNVKRWQENDLIFPSMIGTPMDPTNLTHFHGELIGKIGLPKIRFHDLRHTAATLMLQEGIHPKVVQERLGHSTITMTLDQYSHVLPGMQDEAAERLDTLLTPIPVKAISDE